MRAGASTANVIRALVTVIRARGSRQLVVRQTCAGAVASIRVGAVIVGQVATGRACGQVRMGAYPRTANIVGAIISVVGAPRAVDEVRMRATAETIADIVRTLVTVVAAGGARQYVIRQTRPVRCHL